MSRWCAINSSLVLLIAVCAVAMSVEPPFSSVEGDSKFVVLAQGWADGVGGNRPDELNQILDQQYQHIHGTGLLETKAQFLEALRNGSRKYQPIHLEELEVKNHENFALVTGKFPLKAEVGGKVIEGVNRFCMILIRRAEGWKILQFQATALPAKS